MTINPEKMSHRHKGNEKSSCQNCRILGNYEKLHDDFEIGANQENGFFAAHSRNRILEMDVSNDADRAEKNSSLDQRNGLKTNMMSDSLLDELTKNNPVKHAMALNILDKLLADVISPLGGPRGLISPLGGPRGLISPLGGPRGLISPLGRPNQPAKEWREKTTSNLARKDIVNLIREGVSKTSLHEDAVGKLLDTLSHYGRMDLLSERLRPRKTDVSEK